MTSELHATSSLSSSSWNSETHSWQSAELIKKSPSSMLLLVSMEFRLILIAVVSSLLVDAGDILELDWVVAESTTFASEDFPYVSNGNCTAKIIDNNKTKFIIA